MSAPTEARMKKVRMVFCHYAGKWIPMGRARTRCPSCGAVVGGTTSHQVELREPEEGLR